MPKWLGGFSKSAKIGSCSQKSNNLFENHSRDLPADYFDKLDDLTRQGYRVIALAEAFPKLRALKALKAQREVLEENASFLGFLILQKIPVEYKCSPYSL